MARRREENAQHFQAPRTDTMVSRNGRNSSLSGMTTPGRDVVEVLVDALGPDDHLRPPLAEARLQVPE